MASTKVVIKGEAITAGSNFMALARRGREAPTNFAMTTVTARVRHTVSMT